MLSEIDTTLTNLFNSCYMSLFTLFSIRHQPLRNHLWKHQLQIPPVWSQSPSLELELASFADSGSSLGSSGPDFGVERQFAAWSWPVAPSARSWLS